MERIKDGWIEKTQKQNMSERTRDQGGIREGQLRQREILGMSFEHPKPQFSFSLPTQIGMLGVLKELE